MKDSDTHTMATPSKHETPFVREAEDHEATKIGRLYTKAGKCEVDVVTNYLKCGQLLIAKKEAISGGKWGDWLKQMQRPWAGPHRAIAHGGCGKMAVNCRYHARPSAGHQPRNVG
jgi:hypothetical protein